MLFSMSILTATFLTAIELPANANTSWLGIRPYETNDARTYKTVCSVRGDQALSFIWHFPAQSVARTLCLTVTYPERMVYLEPNHQLRPNLAGS